MGQANLLGGAGGGGIREKSITQARYDALTKSERENPYIIWIITDNRDVAIDGRPVSELQTRATIWNTYQSLSDDDRLDPKVQWIITDKSVDDLLAMGFSAQGQERGSQLYNITAEIDHQQLVALVNDLRRRVAQLEDALTKTSDVLNA